MASELTNTQIKEFKKTLMDRLDVVLEETREILKKSDSEQYAELTGRVHDLQEESVADLLVDLNLADIDRHVDEVRAIEAALLRIADLSYGTCTDCNNPIQLERLKAQPTASRCFSCQDKYEHTHIQTGHHSL